jgi:hypothetical protein
MKLKVRHGDPHLKKVSKRLGHLVYLEGQGLNNRIKNRVIKIPLHMKPKGSGTLLV